MSVKACALCRANLLTKYGNLGTVIPFFRETENKEFLSKLKKPNVPVIIAELITSIGIKTSCICSGLSKKERDCTYVCRNCARKAINCYSMYHEIVTLLEDNSQSEVSLINSSTIMPKRDIVRSPSGLTPQKKKRNTTCSADCASKRNLCFAGDQTCSVDEEISNLMNLPLATNEKHEPTVKVSLYTFYSRRYIFILLIYTKPEAVVRIPCVFSTVVSKM